MLTRARTLGVQARWLVGDVVYGGRELRHAARALGFDYALAVRTGHGLKGDRHYDWAMLGVRPDDTPDNQAPGHAYLLVRRHRYTGELSFYRCHSAAPVALAALVDAVCCR